MANTAIIRSANGLPATFAGSKTGQDDAPFVFVKVGAEERRIDGPNGTRSPPGLVPVLYEQPKTNRAAFAPARQHGQLSRFSL